MQRMRTRLIGLSLLLTFICSCAGGMSLRREHADLPEEDIALLGGQIEELVLNIGLDAPVDSDYKLDPETGEPLGEIDAMSILGGTDEIREKIPALSALNADNEIILAAIRGRILRRPAIREFQKKGCLGENRNGLLQYLKSDGCSGSREAKDRAANTAYQENRDRRAIYEQLVEANNLAGSSVDRIREIFAGEIYKKAWAGTPLQKPDGTWGRK